MHSLGPCSLKGGADAAATNLAVLQRGRAAGWVQRPLEPELGSRLQGSVKKRSWIRLWLRRLPASLGRRDVPMGVAVMHSRQVRAGLLLSGFSSDALPRASHTQGVCSAAEPYTQPETGGECGNILLPRASGDMAAQKDVLV